MLLGLCARKFLEVVVPKCAGLVVRVGRTVLVPFEVAERTLLAMATEDGGCGVPEIDDEGQPASVDALLASVGVRPRAGR